MVVTTEKAVEACGHWLDNDRLCRNRRRNDWGEKEDEA